MNNQRLMKLGRLAELRKALSELEREVCDDLDSLMTATFVLNSPFDLDGARIESAARRISDLLRRGNQVRQQIDSLQEELGE